MFIKNKWPEGVVCPCPGAIFKDIYRNISIYIRSQGSVYRTNGPLVTRHTISNDDVTDTVEIGHWSGCFYVR